MPIHINSLHNDTLDMMILCFYNSLPYIHYFSLHINELHLIFCFWYLFKPLVGYQYRSIILILFLFFFFKQAFQFCHRGACRKWVESSSYISIHLLRKFSNVSASNNVLRYIYKSWYSPTFFDSNGMKICNVFDV